MKAKKVRVAITSDKTYPITNAALAELLALAAEEKEGFVAKAMRRAARYAHFWPVEAAELVAAGRSVTELPGIGNFLQRKLAGWIENPPAIPPRPPLRSHFITLTEARRLLARNPAWRKKYRGDLQMHSRWSDGTASIQEMAQTASIRGYEYIGITDHSKGLKIAGGIDESELEKQAEEIAAVNSFFPRKRFRVLRSIEMNLSPGGAGDMESAALAKLDLVVGSFHSALRKTEDQTQRYLAALRNPDIQILGHPRGRIYNYRLGLSADWNQVFDLAAELDKAIEVDAYPDRQDIDCELLELARRAGVRISIDTDAHTPEELEWIDIGLGSVLKAGIPADRIINFLPAHELVDWASSVRVKAASMAI